MEDNNQQFADVIDNFIREELPKHRLTEEQFSYVASMSKIEAIKFLVSFGFGCKEAACYYDLYKEENYND